MFSFTDASFPEVILEKFFYYNILKVFPACRKMEAEIIRILCSLFHGSIKTCGSLAPSTGDAIILTCLGNISVLKKS